VVNLSSVGGLTTFPAVGFYHVAKFAVEGLSETLAKQVAAFGWLHGRGAWRVPHRFPGPVHDTVETSASAYADTAGKACDNVLASHGKQQGDLMLGAKAIIAALEPERPPLHLAIGGDALDLIRKKIAD
jgi:NAD(P)-dependent dehydrogenase (short-subunit alcohol dehydrogenase family)